MSEYGPELVRSVGLVPAVEPVLRLDEGGSIGGVCDCTINKEVIIDEVRMKCLLSEIGS